MADSHDVRTTESRRRTGLVTYITAGDPSLARSREVLLALARAGADVLEVGVPFSDPLADGPVIQRATERALAAGATLDKRARRSSRTCGPTSTAPHRALHLREPLARMGFERFAGARPPARASTACSRSTCPSRRPDEFRDLLARHGLDTIFLLSPTTTTERIRRAARARAAASSTASRAWASPARATQVAAGAAALAARVRARDHAAARARLRHLAAGARRGGRAVGRCGGRGQRPRAA